MTIVLPILGFMFASLVVVAGAMMLSPATTVVERRFDEIAGGRIDVPAETPDRRRHLVAVLTRLSRYAPRRFTEISKTEQRLQAAGYRAPEAVPMFIGIRVACALGGFMLVATPILVRPSLSLGLGATALGYLLPAMVLARLAKRRQHRIRLALADALDLMVVSVEAGLGLDQALQRVSEELVNTHPDLSTELRLVNLELRAGTARVEALRHLAERTGVEDVSSLVAMLVQTDKFGTSVAQSLRVHSDTLRTKRRQRAEEAAAKTGVKMVFPLVFCIFPAVWVVTIGPAAIKIVQVLLPMVHKK